MCHSMRFVSVRLSGHMYLGRRGAYDSWHLFGVALLPALWRAYLTAALPQEKRGMISFPGQGVSPLMSACLISLALVTRCHGSRNERFPLELLGTKDTLPRAAA